MFKKKEALAVSYSKENKEKSGDCIKKRNDFKI